VPREADGTGAANEDGGGEEAPAANQDGSGAEAVPPDVLPEEPEGWFGQGELDLAAPGQADREAKTDAGSGPVAGATESDSSGSAKDAAPEPALAPGSVSGESGGEDTAARQPADDKAAPAPPEADDGDGLIRL